MDREYTKYTLVTIGIMLSVISLMFGSYVGLVVVQNGLHALVETTTHWKLLLGIILGLSALILLRISRQLPSSVDAIPEMTPELRHIRDNVQ